MLALVLPGLAQCMGDVKGLDVKRLGDEKGLVPCGGVHMPGDEVAGLKGPPGGAKEEWGYIGECLMWA